MDSDYHLASMGCRLLFTAFAATPLIRGRENLDEVPGPYIVACNHTSLIDPALLLGYYPDPIRFLAKAELLETPWIGFIEKRLGNIHLKRDGRDIGPIRQALKMLKNEKWCLVVFVEGTRTDEDSGLGQFKDGAAMLAARAKVPVVPIRLENTGRAAPPGTIVPVWHRLILHIGAPVDLGFGEGKPDQDALDEGSERIRRAILELGSGEAD